MQSQFQKAGMSLKLVQSVSRIQRRRDHPMPVGQRSDMLFFSWYPDYNHPADYMFPIMDSKAIPPNGYNSGYYANTSVDTRSAGATSSRTRPSFRICSIYAGHHQ